MWDCFKSTDGSFPALQINYAHKIKLGAFKRVLRGHNVPIVLDNIEKQVRLPKANEIEIS